MSMKRDNIIHDTHSRAITALGSSPARREIYLGFEDGCVKSYEIDTGKKQQTYYEHKGWITAFLYWPVSKLLFCSANDGIISVIGSGGNVMDRIYIGIPIYSMVLNNRRHEIILGVGNSIQFHKLFEAKEGFSHYIRNEPGTIIDEHRDIVRCVVALEYHLYSAGYDGALIIYDCRYDDEDESAEVSFKNSRAHDAGISCLVVEKDNIENNVWVFTGSFDKTIKVWTGDGKIVHKFEGFLSGITGICYIPKNKTICCVTGNNLTVVFDPKSGEDVTDFIDTFADNLNLHLLKYLNDYNIMLASTNRRQLVIYKYNPSGCITSLNYKQTLDSICYTTKSPILIFTGDSNSIVSKWEQKQSNQLVYTNENLMKSEMVAKETSRNQTQNLKKKNNSSQLNMNSKDNQLNQIKRTNVVSKLVYVESLDFLLAACEDACIYVYCFDEEAVKILKNMKFTEENNKHDQDENQFKSYNKYLKSVANVNSDDFDNTAVEIDENSIEDFTSVKKEDNDSVTNRVAGFVLKKILSEHTSCVTSLVVVKNKNLNQGPSRYLLSAGWDRRVCIWNLDDLKYVGVFRNKSTGEIDKDELASDGNILDMCYCEKNDYFAHASTDSMVYIRKFSPIGTEMVLIDTLQGHLTDVNVVKWVDIKDLWVTGGEDGTLRIWSENCDQLHVINCNGPVNSICIDLVEDVIMAACHDLIKVFDMTEYQLVQKNSGHHDSIRDICFIPERNHIVSVSWDKTIKVWKSYRKQSSIRKKIEKDDNKKFENWVWNQMKMAIKNQNPFDSPNFSWNA